MSGVNKLAKDVSSNPQNIFLTVVMLMGGGGAALLWEPAKELIRGLW